MSQERVPIGATIARLAIAEVSDDLSKNERQMLAHVLALIDNEKVETTVAAAVARIYGVAEEPNFGAFRKARERLEDTLEGHTGLRIAVDDARNRDNDKRRLWLEAYTADAERWTGEITNKLLTGHPGEEFVSRDAISLEDGRIPPIRIAFLADVGDAQDANPVEREIRSHLPALLGPQGVRRGWELLSKDPETGESKEAHWRRIYGCDLVLVWLSHNSVAPGSELRSRIELPGFPLERTVNLHSHHFEMALFDRGLLETRPVIGFELALNNKWSRRGLMKLLLDFLGTWSGEAGEAGSLMRGLERPSSDIDSDFEERLEKLLHDRLHSGDRPFVCPHANSYKTLDAVRLEPSDGHDRTIQKTDALGLLTSWRDEPDGTPYYAVLGELGIGKTTLLRQFALQNIHERVANPLLPHVIYLDLRDYSATIQEKRSVPDTQTLVQELLDSAWKSGLDWKLEASQVIHLVQRGAILIMDGLDEKLTHLGPDQARAFMQRIWAIAPPFIDPKTKKRQNRGRIIVSCRSHFFATLKEQSAFLKAQHRDNVRDSDYEAMILLPFQESQIQEYLEKVLGNEAALAAMDTLRSIHDLMQLSTRPLLLSFIAPMIERLEEQRAGGKTVRSIDLYRDLVSDWIVRDDEKHQIDPMDKRRLMPRLATAMWAEGARQWPWPRLDAWFKTQIADDRTMLYETARVPVLLEDLRNATFVVRSADSDDAFRFAHTSLLEFFLAQGLFEDVGGPAWSGPMPSDETFAFLSEMLEEVPARNDRLVHLLETRNGPTTKAALRYFLLARQKGWAFPQPSKFALSGQDLYAWKFTGAKQRPLDLSFADFSESNLMATDWLHVRLVSASLDRAYATGAIFNDVDFRGTSFQMPAVPAHLAARTLRGSDEYCHQYAIVRQSFDPPPPLCSQEFDVGLQPSCQFSVILGGGHKDWVRSAAFSPDGRTLVSGSNDNTLILWDGHSGKQIRTLEGHKGWVMSAAFSPDGKTLVSGSVDKTLILWDVQSGKQIRTLNGHKLAVRSAAFSSDGRTLVSGSNDKTLILWDVQNGKRIRTLKGQNYPVSSAAFSPDGRTLVSGSWDKTLILWDVQSGKQIRTLEGHNDSISCAAFSPDGRILVSGSDDKTLILWDGQSGKQIRTLKGHNDSVRSAAFSPDGRILVSGSDDKTLILWDAQSGKRIRILKGHKNWVYSAAFSPDGRTLVSGSNDKTLILWDGQSGKQIRTFEGHKNWVSSAAFSPDGRTLVSGSNDETLILWDVQSGKRIRTLEGPNDWVTSAAFSPDGRPLVLGSRDKTPILWDVQSGKQIRTLEGHNDSISCAAFSPDGRTLVSGSHDNTLILWDGQSGKQIRTLKGHNDSIRSAAFSPDGRILVSGSDDKTLILWDAQSGKRIRILKGHKNWVYSAAFSPDGRTLVSGSWDKTLILWDVQNGKRIRTLEGHNGIVRSAAFSPDGSTLISGANDNTLILWDSKSGKQIRTFEGHKHVVTSAGFSPDGRTIVSGSGDGTLILWDALTGEPQMLLLHGDEETWAAYDYRRQGFLHLGDQSWRSIGIVGYNMEGRLQWFMPEVRLLV